MSISKISFLLSFLIPWIFLSCADLDTDVAARGRRGIHGDDIGGNTATGNGTTSGSTTAGTTDAGGTTAGGDPGGTTGDPLTRINETCWSIYSGCLRGAYRASDAQCIHDFGSWHWICAVHESFVNGEWVPYLNGDLCCGPL